VLITDGPDAGAVRKLEDAGIERVPASIESSGRLKDYVGFCVRSATYFTDNVLDAFGGSLKVVARAGVDNIDLRAASKRGVAVVKAPTAATIAVAELTVGHAISILRHIPAADRAARNGRWIKGRLIGRELHDRRIGVGGFGRIGSMVGERFRQFGAHVIAYDQRPGQMRYAKSQSRSTSCSLKSQWSQCICHLRR
jgi:phosphoglycerate dehydrogenase-like enzyme